MLISKKPWVGGCEPYFSPDNITCVTETNLRIAQIRFSSRIVIRYRSVSSIPVVVEVNFASATYSIDNRETDFWAMVGVTMLPMPMQGRQTRIRREGLQEAVFFQVVVDERALS